MKIFVIGGGGREHAIILKLLEDERVSEIYCAPGNGGIAKVAKCVDIKATDIDAITDYSVKENFDLVFVAPDDPLSLGLVNRLNEKGIRAFGPTKEAAIIEASKAFSKDLMKKYGIPTAAYEVFDDYKLALDYVKTSKMPLVIKADGLALGKGVVICKTVKEAVNAINDMMQKKVFGAAGERVVVEEFLTGPEVSILTFCDGKTVVPMISAQDHKRIYDYDRGPNTGGMGTFAPSPKYTKKIKDFFEQNIMQRTVDAMREEGREFKGVLYFGLILTKDGPRVLEYNARFGDPETQVILPLLKTSLLTIVDSIIDGNLKDINIEWENKCCVCVVLASGGYPVSYKKNKIISGLNEVDDDIIIYHAGTVKKGDKILTSGGRVLGVVAKDSNIKSAREKAYKNILKIHFENMHYRHDIGIK
ncbi:MAG: phosphoribosylamine--glycine ligase [Eubacteriales bacterium]